MQYNSITSIATAAFGISSLVTLALSGNPILTIAFNAWNNTHPTT